jgi:hypothetical protein
MGSVNGFIDNALLIKVNEELDGEAFENRLKTQLIPNLPENCIIILDNAQTHSKHHSSIEIQSPTNQKTFY